MERLELVPLFDKMLEKIEEWDPAIIIVKIMEIGEIVMDQINQNPDQVAIKQKLLALRLVTGSMWAGMFIFLGMTVFVQPSAAVQTGLDSDDIAILQLMGKSFTALAVAVAIVLRMSIARLIGRAQTLVLAMQRYFVVTLMVFAFGEGVAFFCLAVVHPI